MQCWQWSSNALSSHPCREARAPQPLKGPLLALGILGVVLMGGGFSAEAAGAPAKKGAVQTAPAAPAPASKAADVQAPTPAPASNAAAAEEAKLQDIRRVLILTGSDKLALQVMQQMIGQFKQAMPQVPDAFWAEFMSEVNPSEIVELAVPIYAKYLTHEEIKDLLRFYESPSGSKFVSVLPQITQESMLAGQTWGANIGERALRKLQEKGFAP